MPAVLHLAFPNVADLVYEGETTWNDAREKARALIGQWREKLGLTQEAEAVGAAESCLFEISSDSNLDALDGEFMSMSAGMAEKGLGGHVCVFDFLAMRTQAYEGGEYDEGSISDGGRHYSNWTERQRIVLQIPLGSPPASAAGPGPANEDQFGESEWFASVFGKPIHESAGLRPDSGDDLEADWVCFLCGREDDMSNFERCMCDGCFELQLHRWAVLTHQVLIEWLQCGEEGCPCWG